MIRSRKIFLVYFLLLLTSILLLIVLNPIPQIKHLVHETNAKINDFQPFHKHEVENDQTYLEYLGLSHTSNNISHLPPTTVIGSAVSSVDFRNAFLFLESVNISLSSIYDYIILFDIGLRSWHINLLKKQCNSFNNCEIRNFQFDKFPHHISHLDTKSYKPLAVQILLQQYHIVIWIDLWEPQLLPLDNFAKYWRTIVSNISLSGVQGWPIMWPTSSVTHPGMFTYLHLSPDSFYFHHMMSTKYFVISNSDFVRTKIMQPWIKCTLSYECIAPMGSHRSGCNFHREPHFLYSGCHWFEMSAFNIVLGLAYQMNTSRYMFRFPPISNQPGSTNVTSLLDSYLNYSF